MKFIEAGGWKDISVDTNLYLPLHGFIDKTATEMTGPQVGIRTQVHCSEDKAPVHVTPALLAELMGAMVLICSIRSDSQKWENTSVWSIWTWNQQLVSCCWLQFQSCVGNNRKTEFKSKSSRWHISFFGTRLGCHICRNVTRKQTVDNKPFIYSADAYQLSIWL